jgi:hypothetical protein
MELEHLPIDGWPFELRGIAYGQGQRLQLEVLYSDHHRKPNLTDLRSAWKRRQNARGVPLPFRRYIPAWVVASKDFSTPWPQFAQKLDSACSL